MYTVRTYGAALAVTAAGALTVGVLQTGQAAGRPTTDTRAAGHRSSEVIRLVEADSTGRDIDAKPRGESVGDYLAFHSVMEDLNGRPVGRADGFAVLTAVGDKAAAQHFVTLTLHDGQITTAYAPQADIDNGNGPQAITGGTGRYRNARGEVTFEEQGDRVVAVVHIIR
jgi:hypothetical protein